MSGRTSAWAVVLWAASIAAAAAEVPSAADYGPSASTITMDEWRGAATEYKLLAAGEWAYSVLGEAWLARNGYELLGRRAAGIVLCLDDSSVGIAASGRERVAELAAFCMALMGWTPAP